VSVIDARTHQVVATVPVGGYPEGIAVHGGRVYVVNWMDDNVAVMDASSFEVLGTVETGKNSRGFGQFIGAP
jgi:YVTN family beta-propeller protein